MATALNYGPYYLSAIRKAESQKKALGGRAYTPEELAGLAYGELSAKYEKARATKRDEEQLNIQQQGLNLQATGQAAALRSQEKAAKSAERGNIVSGIATGVNVLDKVGALKWGGDTLKTGGKAISGLISPQPAVTGGSIYGGGGAEDIWTGGDYGIDYGGGYEVAEGAGAMAGIGDYDYSWVGGGYDTGYEEVFTESIGAGTVICTELFRQGLLDEKTYLADSAYGSLLDDEILIGYRVWGEGVARLMRESKTFTKVVSLFSIPWAKEMAYQMGVLDKGHWLGRTMNIVGIPICRLIGRLIIGGALCHQAG